MQQHKTQPLSCVFFLKTSTHATIRVFLRGRITLKKRICFEMDDWASNIHNREINWQTSQVDKFLLAIESQ